MDYNIEIISAPSILGLKQTGVELLSKSLLDCGLARRLSSEYPIVNVPTYNEQYDDKRDEETKCINIKLLKEVLKTLSKTIIDTIGKNHFSLVLGGDCSILIGIMLGLKAKGNYGLIYLDAHADFYEPEKSTTGEVADMGLAIITGRGPEILTDIDDLRPYAIDKNIIHLGQRDWEETKKYNSQDIKETSIKCIDASVIESEGVDFAVHEVINHLNQSIVDGIWIHFDTDVLADEINPAVDYRLPGGLKFEQVEQIIGELLLTGKVVGMSVAIFNPTLDRDGSVARALTDSLTRIFHFNKDRPHKAS